MPASFGAGIFLCDTSRAIQDSKALCCHPLWMTTLIEDHPVRVIDAFVDTLNMKALDFSKAETQVMGRKPYHTGDLLKLYI
jgi:hypothetical protein